MDAMSRVLKRSERGRLLPMPWRMWWLSNSLLSLKWEGMQGIYKENIERK
jgi:hypothetical protein